jgi:hypothetical protein
MSTAHQQQQRLSVEFIRNCEREHDISRLESLILYEGVDVNALISHPNSSNPEDEAYPLLMFAGRNGWCEGVAFLLMHGADPHLVGNANTPRVTPFTDAQFNDELMRGGSDEVYFLIVALVGTGNHKPAYDARGQEVEGWRDPNRPFEARGTGRPPVMYAFVRRFPWCVRWLVERRGVNLFSADLMGKSGPQLLMARVEEAFVGSPEDPEDAAYWAETSESIIREDGDFFKQFLHYFHVGLADPHEFQKLKALYPHAGKCMQRYEEGLRILPMLRTRETTGGRAR